MPGPLPKSSFFPSGDQDTSCSGSWPEVTRRGVPPVAVTTKILAVSDAVQAVNAICVPSGDQRGNAARIGGNVSCTRPLPSAPLRQSVPSGNVV